MSLRWTVWADWKDVFPESVRPHLDGPVGYAVLAAVGLIALLILLLLVKYVLRALVGGWGKDDESGLRERLAEYPPPGPPGSRRLTVEGIPVRVRLVVVAPVGKEHAIAEADVAGLVDGVLRGLRDVLAEDRPRVRVWPPQLSRQGFAPTFHRETEKPESEGRPSRWILVAGQASSGRKPILLGLALWADAPNTLGRVTLDTGRWGEALRIQTRES
ncbi:MAG: hypothetical protein HYS12_17895 [Planctomycetes bacterium]|nr:hypothetical protein [Planctomycetota bacterium]